MCRACGHSCERQKYNDLEPARTAALLPRPPKCRSGGRWSSREKKARLENSLCHYMHNRIRLGGAHPADLLDIKAISCSFVRRPFPVLGTEYPCFDYYLLVITLSTKIRPQRSLSSSDSSGTFPLFASQFSWLTPVKIDWSANRATLNGRNAEIGVCCPLVSSVAEQRSACGRPICAFLRACCMRGCQLRCLLR